MTSNYNFSIQLPENIDSKIPIAFELITSSKNATATVGQPTLLRIIHQLTILTNKTIQIG